VLLVVLEVVGEVVVLVVLVAGCEVVTRREVVGVVSAAVVQAAAISIMAIVTIVQNLRAEVIDT